MIPLFARQQLKLLCLFLLSGFLLACNDDLAAPSPPKKAEPFNISISPDVTYQTIAGFGGANVMWGSSVLSAGEIKKAFGTDETDLGLSILRVRISPNPAEWQNLLSTLKEVKKYNAKIIASPWSPPAHLKSNNSLLGGELLEEHYAAYVEHLNNFVAFMANQGVTIDVVSIQNEPDIKVTYESCDWTVSQLLAFMKNHAASIQGAKVAASESFNFNQSYTDALLNDVIAVENLDIVAGHIYGGGLARYPVAEQKGKEIWMTEYLLNMNVNWDRTNDVKIWNESMTMLSTIHDSMLHNWNAYIWWYLKRYYSFLGDGEEWTTTGEILKRGYAMSQYSKFIRPGYTRIEAKPERNTELKISAYKGNNQLVVVLINPTDNPIPAINLSVPQAVSSAVSYTTSAYTNREKAVIAPEAGNVLLKMAPNSITTVVVEL